MLLAFTLKSRRLPNFLRPQRWKYFQLVFGLKARQVSLRSNIFLCWRIRVLLSSDIGICCFLVLVADGDFCLLLDGSPESLLLLLVPPSRLFDCVGEVMPSNDVHEFLFLLESPLPFPHSSRISLFVGQGFLLLCYNHISCHSRVVRPIRALC